MRRRRQRRARCYWAHGGCLCIYSSAASISGPPACDDHPHVVDEPLLPFRGRSLRELAMRSISCSTLVQNFPLPNGVSAHCSRTLASVCLASASHFAAVRTVSSSTLAAVIVTIQSTTKMAQADSVDGDDAGLGQELSYAARRSPRVRRRRGLCLIMSYSLLRGSFSAILQNSPICGNARPSRGLTDMTSAEFHLTCNIGVAGRDIPAGTAMPVVLRRVSPTASKRTTAAKRRTSQPAVALRRKK